MSKSKQSMIVEDENGQIELPVDCARQVAEELQSDAVHNVEMFHTLECVSLMVSLLDHYEFDEASGNIKLLLTLEIELALINLLERFGHIPLETYEILQSRGYRLPERSFQ